MRWRFLLVCAVFQVSLMGQSIKKIFGPPMQVPLIVTSGFGEIRPNHFHAGVDFSTYGKAQNITSVADGYVSRIKISLSGYGNALYLDHPGGFTSVYGHMGEFAPDLMAFAEKMQRNALEYEIDVLLDSAQFVFKKGQVIGKSGNSGSSTAPHLHFEIRDRVNENVFNPLMFGFIEDKAKPTAFSLLLIPKDGYGTVNASTSDLRIPLLRKPKSTERYVSPKTLTPVLSGWVGFGLEGGDEIGKPGNYSGIYKFVIKVNNEQIFTARFDEFSFEENRAVNAWIDYPMKRKANKKYQRCVVPANQLIGIYKSHVDQGYYEFNRDTTYQITWELTDISGNTTVQTLEVKGKAPSPRSNTNEPQSEHVRVYPRGGELSKTNNFKAVFSDRCLYDTADVKLIVHPAGNAFSPLVELGSVYIPLHSSVELQFKPNVYKTELKDKLFIGRKDGQSYDALNSSWDGDWLIASTKEFGDFQVLIDTIAPVITYVPERKRIPKTKRYREVPIEESKSIRLRLYDPIGGNFSWQAYLNQEWMLMKPSSRKNEWYFDFPNDLSSGTHVVSVLATDVFGNANTFELPFTLP
jgi:hypothetical protein